MSAYADAADRFSRPPCHFCAPSLLMTDGDLPMFEPASALGLSALEDDNWTGKWSLTLEDKQKLLDDIGRETALIASQDLQKQRNNMASKLIGMVRAKTGAPPPVAVDKISLLEIQQWAAMDDNRAKVETMPNSIHGILNENMMKEAFHFFDQDDSGTLDKAEWSAFLDRLAYLHLKFLLCLAFLDFRAFMARGQPWEMDPTNFSMNTLNLVLSKAVESSPPSAGSYFTSTASIIQASYKQLPTEDPDDQEFPFKTFQCGYDYDCSGCWVIPTGWVQDFFYYSANNHPLHGIFACDRFHPLSWIERLQMELATFGMAFLTLILHERWVGHESQAAVPALANPVVFSLVIVTIPGLILWWALFLLFTCKCGNVNEAQADTAEIESGAKLRCAGETIGHMIVVVMILFLIWAGINSLHLLQPVIFGRAKGYVIAWLMMVFVYFNPLIAWGQPDPKGAFCLGDLIGLGQWRIEKQRFQVMCLRGIADIKRAKRSEESQASDASRNTGWFGRAKQRMANVGRPKFLRASK